MFDATPRLTPIDLLRSQTLSGLVQEEILREIKTGQLEAGAKLNEIELAERLQISRSPVREAFRALEEAGLVRLEKNRGVFIREISTCRGRRTVRGPPRPGRDGRALARPNDHGRAACRS